MLRLDQPLRFEPFLRPMVWGGGRLPSLLGHTVSSKKFGEAWLTSDHPLHRSVVAEGPLQGRTLRELMEQHRAELLGNADLAQFPWLVKLLDCRQLLSVQVHPDKAAAERLAPGQGSKTEAWFVLDVEPEGRVWAGLKPGVDEAKLRKALAEKSVVECLHSFVPKAGDCIFLPAGTVHAVGGGVLLAEIQETSDVTFRLYDWDRVDDQGRSRELHIEQALTSIHWDAGPVTPIRADGDRDLVRCDVFVLEHRRATGPIDFAPGSMRTLIVVGGEGTWADGRRLAVGDAWVLPAAMKPTTLTPAGSLAFISARLR